jgi:hypothetical protein
METNRFNMPRENRFDVVRDTDIVSIPCNLVWEQKNRSNCYSNVFHSVYRDIEFNMYVNLDDTVTFTLYVAVGGIAIFSDTSDDLSHLEIEAEEVVDSFYAKFGGC